MYFVLRSHSEPSLLTDVETKLGDSVNSFFFKLFLNTTLPVHKAVLMPVPEAAPHIGDGAPVGTCRALCLSAVQATSHEAWDPRGSGSTQGGFLFISPTQAQVYHRLCPWTWLRFLLFCLYVFKFFVSNYLHFPPALTRPLKPIATAPQSFTLKDSIPCNVPVLMF